MGNSGGLRGALQIPPLRSPGFPVKLVALMQFMPLSLRKGAHVALSSAAWQEIRVRSGRDDNFVLGTVVIVSKMNCHSNRRIC
jgi:hypothetical protein